MCNVLFTPVCFLSIEFDFNLFLIPQGNNVAMFVNEKAVEKLITIFRTACHDILRSTLDDRTILGKIITFHKNVSLGLVHDCWY